MGYILTFILNFNCSVKFHEKKVISNCLFVIIYLCARVKRDTKQFIKSYYFLNYRSGTS